MHNPIDYVRALANSPFKQAKAERKGKKKEYRLHTAYRYIGTQAKKVFAVRKKVFFEEEWKAAEKERTCLYEKDQVRFMQRAVLTRET